MFSRSIRRPMIAALVPALLALCFAAVAQARPGPGEFAGVNIQKLIFDFPQSARPAHFDAMEGAGVELVRFDALWQWLEPRPPVNGVHTYRWERSDPIVRELAKRGIRWLPIIAYATTWSATTNAHYAAPPRDLSEFAEFAAAVAGRYGAGGSFWRENPDVPALPVTDYEIWNAPNNPAHWHPSPDAARYADMYLTSRERIRSLDPDADVWVGGLAGDDAVWFVRHMYRAQPALRGNVDAIAVHAYARDATRAIELVTNLRAHLDALGEEDVGTPVTETGWATQGDGPGWRVSDRERARYLEEMAMRLGRSDCGVWTLMAHTWTTREENPFAAGDWFGIVRPNRAHTASSRSYFEALGRVAGRASADLPLCDRPLAIDVGPRVTRVSRRVRKRSSRTGRVTRVRRTFRRTCHLATVTVGSSPLEGATVRFHYVEKRGRRRRNRTVVRTTLADGTAHVCRTRPARRGRYRRRSLDLRQVKASHVDFVHGAAAARRLRLP